MAPAQDPSGVGLFIVRRGDEDLHRAPAGLGVLDQLDAVLVAQGEVDNDHVGAGGFDLPQGLDDAVGLAAHL